MFRYRFGRIWRPRPLRLHWSVVVAIILVAAIVLFNLRVDPMVRGMATYQGRVLATRAVNEAATQVMAEQNIGYEQLAVVSRTESGEITAIQANMVEINRLTTDITARIIENIETLDSNKDVAIPLGTLLGGHLLAGRGPGIAFGVVPTGFVETDIANQFESAGINQTRHQIVLSVKVGIFAVLPTSSTETTLNVSICLAETVIVGAVPEYFTQIDTAGDSEMPNWVADYGGGNVQKKDIQPSVK